MTELLLNWTEKWLFKQMLPWQGGEAVCNRVQTSGPCSMEERTLHMSVLELLAIKLTLFFFTKGKRVKAIHFQIDSKAALTFENGRTKKEHMVKSSREIWHYLLNHNTSITVEYLSSVLNTVADMASRKKTNSSKWHFSFQSFSSGFSTTWFSNNRSICFPPMPSTTSIYNLTFWFLQSGDRCNDTKLEQRSSLYISLF